MVKKEKISTMLLMAPALFVIILLVVMVGYGVYASFTNQALVGVAAKSPKFLGLKNYARAFKDPEFITSLSKTWWFTFGSAIIGQCGLGLLLAIILKQKWIRGKALVSAAILSCWVIPDVVAGFVMTSFWSSEGLLNKFLAIFGISPIEWLYKHPMLSIIIANIWRGTGWSLLLFSAALETIPQEYYDAADVDGASSWYKFRTITLPLALPVIVINLFLITIWTWGYFDLPFIMTHGGPGTATLIYPILVYRKSFMHYTIGYGSALSVINMLILCALVAVYLYLLRRSGGGR